MEKSRVNYIESEGVNQAMRNRVSVRPGHSCPGKRQKEMEKIEVHPEIHRGFQLNPCVFLAGSGS